VFRRKATPAPEWRPPEGYSVHLRQDGNGCWTSRSYCGDEALRGSPSIGPIRHGRFYQGSRGYALEEARETIEAHLRQQRAAITLTEEVL
jgi:hypothetical protein